MLFRKKIPDACPKCGRADGWHLVREEQSYNDVSSNTAVNPFSSAPIRNTFGQNMTGKVGRRNRLKYRCDNCGHEKTY